MVEGDFRWGGERRPRLERLEDRNLLAAGVGSLFDFSALAVNPSSYDPSSILVRFRDDAANEQSQNLASVTDGILDGS